MNRSSFYSLFILLILLPSVTSAQAAPRSKTTSTNEPSTSDAIWIEKIPLAEPSPRSGPAMAYDSGRGVMVLFGGAICCGPSLADTWERVGTAWVERHSTTSPSPRNGHAMAYDAARGVTVLFGGGDNLADTWEWDGMDWLQRTPSTSPPGRTGHVLVYDSVRGVTVLFGGANSNGDLNDTWEYDGTTWTQRSLATTPSPRFSAAAAFDSTRGLVTLFGGRNASCDACLNDTWEWDGTDWTLRLPSTSPSPHFGAALAYDSSRQVAVLFGSGETYGSSDTWEWNGTNWIQRSASEIPPPRFSPGLAYDPNRQAVVMFGGNRSGGFDISGAPFRTWEWDGTNWTEFTRENSPKPRRLHSMAYDSLRDVTVLFGGSTYPGGPLNDTWEWNGTNWSQRFPADYPSARTGHAMAYDSSRNVTVLFGGAGLNDTWEWDGTNWLLRSPVTSPPGRTGAGMVYDSAREVIVLFGGDNRNDTWEWDGNNWTQRTPVDNPPASAFHGMAHDSVRNVTVLFGGNIPTSEVWEWDGTNWTKHTPTIDPGGVFHTTYAGAMVFDSTKGVSVVFGGWAANNFRSDMWEWDGSNWNPGPVSSRPEPRWFHSMVYDSHRQRIVLFGGWAAGDTMDDTWEFGSPIPSNVPPEIDSDNLIIEVNEGAIATNTGEYSDANTGDDVAISASIGTVTKTGTNNGTWSWSLGTIDGPTESQTVTITADDGAGELKTTQFALTVNNILPDVNAGPDATIIAGEIFSSSGSFTDPGADSWMGTVDYMDGSGNQPLLLNPDKTFGLSQTYSAGAYTVTVTITDDDGGVDADTATVTVQTPQQATQNINSDVQQLVANAVLSQKQGDLLQKDLDKAIKELDKGKTDKAIQELQAFIAQVNNLINTGVLTSAQGQPLIDAANEIITALGA